MLEKHVDGVGGDTVSARMDQVLYQICTFLDIGYVRSRISLFADGPA